MLRLLCACALLSAPAAAAPVPVAQSGTQTARSFDPIRFFEGRTEGEGILKIALKQPRPIRVRGTGRIEPDGTLVLRQSVEQAGEPPRTRMWRIREVAPGRYAGTLTDASGPVTGEVRGDRLRLRYRMKGGLKAEQTLTLAPGGRAATNVMKVGRMGMALASLRETIVKHD
jgi:hypothetical protein